MPDHIHPDALWWALALGADFGGNLTAVGASANVVMIGIARGAGHPISFWEFTRKGALVTAVSIGLSAVYPWLRYFVLGQGDGNPCRSLLALLQFHNIANVPAALPRSAHPGANNATPPSPCST